jgi:hypothetical protein
MVIIAPAGAKRSTVREDHAIKGPGIRLDLDVRRVWRCPSCQRVLKTAGHVTSRRCPIDDAFMQLDDSAQRAARPVNLPAIDGECDDNNPAGDADDMESTTVDLPDDDDVTAKNDDRPRKKSRKQKRRRKPKPDRDDEPESDSNLETSESDNVEMNSDQDSDQNSDQADDQPDSPADLAAGQ